MSTKEPYISGKEPYIFEKELYIFTKELYVCAHLTKALESCLAYD